MNKRLLLVLFAVLAQTAVPARAADAWYFAWGLGEAKASDASANLDRITSELASIGLGSVGAYDDGAVGGMFSVGYGRDFAVARVSIEASYVTFGSYTVDVGLAGLSGAAAGVEKDDVSGFAVSVIPEKRITDTFSLYGRVGFGVFNNSDDFRVVGLSQTIGPFDDSGSDSDSSTVPLLGLGVGFGKGPTASIRIEYLTTVGDVGDANNEYTAGKFSLFYLGGLITL